MPQKKQTKKRDRHNKQNVADLRSEVLHGTLLAKGSQPRIIGCTQYGFKQLVHRQHRKSDVNKRFVQYETKHGEFVEDFDENFDENFVNEFAELQL